MYSTRETRKQLKKQAKSCKLTYRLDGENGCIMDWKEEMQAEIEKEIEKLIALVEEDYHEQSKR